MAVNSIKKLDSNRGNADYTSTNQLMTSYMKKAESRASFTKSRAVLNVWVVMVGGMMTLNIVEDEKLWSSVTGGQYL